MSRFLAVNFCLNRVLRNLTCCDQRLCKRNYVPVNLHTDNRRWTYWKPFVILFGFGSGCLLKNWLKTNNLSIETTRAQCSVVKNRSLRERFNFIADVVEDTAEAVVYIEILDTRLVSRFLVVVGDGSVGF